MNSAGDPIEDAAALGWFRLPRKSFISGSWIAVSQSAGRPAVMIKKPFISAIAALFSDRAVDGVPGSNASFYRLALPP
jgi:hypothetical protein